MGSTTCSMQLSAFARVADVMTKHTVSSRGTCPTMGLIMRFRAAGTAGRRIRGGVVAATCEPGD
eukprot:3116877-Rhodomonas_salina.4